MKRKIYVETERLLLAEFLPEDAEGVFEMDSDPDVHEFLGDDMASNIKESEKIIENIRRQYQELKIGRWVVLEKSSGQFTGWSGLKLVERMVNGRTGYYDLGYRFIKRYWGNGYATEAGKASVQFGFVEMGLQEIFADVELNNHRSVNVLKKCGLQMLEKFDDDGYICGWFGINRQEWSVAGLNPDAHILR